MNLKDINNNDIILYLDINFSINNQQKLLEYIYLANEKNSLFFNSLYTEEEYYNQELLDHLNININDIFKLNLYQYTSKYFFLKKE